MALKILPPESFEWPIPYEAVALIAEREGCKLRAYLCPAGVWTIGWGHTKGVKPTDLWTQDYADKMLLQDLRAFTTRVADLCTRVADPYQLGAMVSLAYNIGINGFKGSTVLRQHNAGNDQASARAFALWNKATVNGQLKVLDGLTIRRSLESAMYLKPLEDTPDAVAFMPQAVAPESSLTASPIAQGSVVTAGIGALSMANQFSDQLNQLATTLNINLPVVMGVGLIAAAAWVLYQRFNQRREGWA